jgi:hypothetical protein
MDPLSIAALALSAGSQLWGAHGQNRANAANARFQRQNRRMLLDQMQRGPSEYETLLRSMFLNTGQDGIMQQMRNGPEDQVQQDVINTLMGISQTGDPFDTSEMFKALGLQDARTRDESVATLRAGASGLGQRFGSASGRAEADLLSELADQTALRNAGIQMQSYESAQGRRQQALGGVLQATNAQEAEQMALAQLMQSVFGQLMGAEQGRNSFNAQLLSAASGMGGVQAPSATPGAVGDIGNLLFMLPMFEQLMNPDRRPASTAAASTGPNLSNDQFNSFIQLMNLMGGRAQGAM